MTTRRRNRAGRPKALTTDQVRRVWFEHKYDKKGKGFLAKKYGVDKRTIGRAIEETDALLNGEKDLIVKAKGKPPAAVAADELADLGDHDIAQQRRKDMMEARMLREEGADHMRWSAGRARKKDDHRAADMVGYHMFGRGQEWADSLTDNQKADIEVHLDQRHQELHMTIADHPEVADQALDAALERMAASMGPEFSELLKARLGLKKEGAPRTPSAHASTPPGDEG